MTTTRDFFPTAVRVMSQLRAFEHRAINPGSPHRPVHATTLTAIAALLPGARGQYTSELPTLDEVNALAGRIENLPEKDRHLFMQAQALDTTRWRPLCGPSALGYELAAQVDVLGLGGGAGSGKTETAIGVGLFQQRITRFLRQTAGEFTAILTRIGEVVGSVDGRNLGSNTWQLPSPWGFAERGCAFEWLGLSDADAVLKLQGRPVTNLVLEDAGNGGVSEADYNFASNWLRSTEPDVHKLVTVTMNPPSTNESVAFLRDKLFAPWVSPSYEGTPAKSGEVRWFVREGDAEREVEPGTTGAQSRTLVLSNVLANPFLLRSGYATQLQNAPTAVLRDRLLHGSFTAGWDSDADQQVIPSAWVEAAMNRWTPNAPGPLDMMGVDVARGGRDKTVTANRHGCWIAPLKVIDAHDGQAVAAAVIAARGTSQHAMVAIDVGGVGASPYDLLKYQVPTVPINFGSGTKAFDISNSFSFQNLRSELWWRTREALDPNNIRKLALPPDRVLKQELTAPRFELRAGGKLYVESRDDLIKRLKRSADRATAVILCLIGGDSYIANSSNSYFVRAIQRAMRPASTKET